MFPTTGKCQILTYKIEINFKLYLKKFQSETYINILIHKFVQPTIFGCLIISYIDTKSSHRVPNHI